MATVQPNTARVQKYLTHIKEQEASPHPCILHYDIKSRSLRPWLWSVEVVLSIPSVLNRWHRPENDVGEKIVPNALPSFQAEGFCWPCCFCSIPGLDGVGIGYKESAVYMSIDVEDFREYLMACYRRKCGYEGALMPIKSYKTELIFDHATFHSAHRAAICNAWPAHEAILSPPKQISEPEPL